MGSWLYVDTSLYKDIIEQLHFQGMDMSLAFLDIVVAFTLFCKLTINLLIIVTICSNIVFTYICCL